MTETLTRADIAETVYREIGFSQSESADFVDDVLEEVIKALENGDDVKLSSFGSFKLRRKNARVGRNPKTKVEAIITPRVVVSFYPSNLIKAKVNNNS